MKRALLIFFLVVWKISNSQPILKEEALQLGKSFFDYKGYTRTLIEQVFPSFPLTIEGLEKAIEKLL